MINPHLAVPRDHAIVFDADRIVHDAGARAEFSRAAQSLHVPQPALTKRIRNL
jgi:hypothetical protein